VICNVVVLYVETGNILEFCSAVVLEIHKMYSRQTYHIGERAVFYPNCFLSKLIAPNMQKCLCEPVRVVIGSGIFFNPYLSYNRIKGEK
jgi:hypothetical protein